MRLYPTVDIFLSRYDEQLAVCNRCHNEYIVECCSFFFQAEDGIRDIGVTGVQTCALPILDVESTSANATIDTRTIIIQRFADIVDQDNCFDAEDAGRLYMVIGNVMRNMFSEREGGSNQLQQEIDRLVVQGCPIVDVSLNEPNPGNPSDTTEPSESNSEEGGAADEEEAAADDEEEEAAADDDEEEAAADDEERSEERRVGKE